MPTIAQRYEPTFPIDELVEHPDNPRRGDEEAIEASMAAHGFYGAVLVQASTRRIIAGNHRTRVARRRGDTHLPVLLVDVDDDQARRLLLVDNRTNDDAGYDERELARLLEDLAALDDGLAGTGYDAADLAKLLDRWATPGDPDAIPEPPATPRSQPGDLWILGGHRLLCGDSTNGDDVARLLDGITPLAMVTDPPYLVDYTGQNHPQSKVNNAVIKDKEWDTYRDPDQASDLFGRFLAEALKRLAAEAPVYQWHADLRRTLVADAWRANGLLWHQTLLWVKNRPVLTRSDFMWQSEPCAYGWREGDRPPTRRRPPSNATNVWHLANASANVEHPTIKPVQLYTDPYTWHLRTGEWAYEPFSGSGTAIAAAEVTGRRCAAMELEPAYVDVACARWQQLTGRLPMLERTGEPIDFAPIAAVS